MQVFLFIWRLIHTQKLEKPTDKASIEDKRCLTWPSFWGSLKDDVKCGQKKTESLWMMLQPPFTVTSTGTIEYLCNKESHYFAYFCPLLRMPQAPVSFSSSFIINSSFSACSSLKRLYTFRHLSIAVKPRASSPSIAVVVMYSQSNDSEWNWKF